MSAPGRGPGASGGRRSIANQRATCGCSDDLGHRLKPHRMLSRFLRQCANRLDPIDRCRFSFIRDALKEIRLLGYTVTCILGPGGCRVGISEDRRQRDLNWDGAEIRRLREHAGLSQRELADELNARQQTISEWERGEYAPRGTAARLLTRVAEDVRFPFEAGPRADGAPDPSAEETGAGVEDD
ncbi:MAG: helix-turn-helix transcriptional regulator [Chloroflexi bacterium]|nr:helix-turn-helix transcriptional regulator [Chloroflexota bacterium]MYG89954.1 helix-turn-helix transcriptional regulator [Chloroflexota bacterium]MYJ93683.1 helix-turn-helix transcriptional regulator [Chloroflexota bacterium]